MVTAILGGGGGAWLKLLLVSKGYHPNTDREIRDTVTLFYNAIRYLDGKTFCRHPKG